MQSRRELVRADAELEAVVCNDMQRDRRPQSPMNILHATDVHTQVNTGITFAINELVSHTLPRVSPGGSVTLLSTGQTDVQIDADARHVATSLARGPLSAWRYSPRYGAICEKLIRENSIDVVHVHGAWMHPQLAAVRSAHRLGIPSVLTNHGCVQWALRQPNWSGAMKKRLYVALMRQALFHKVTVHHAITPSDRDAILAFFPRARVEIIPNFIDVPKVDSVLKNARARDAEPYVLFVGRVHPTKGIDMLIEAFARADLPNGWRLVIVGPTVDHAYAAGLQQVVAAHPRGDRIKFRGPVWDPAEKYALMREAWVTVVPSHTEVISLVNLESSACSTPTITTSATGLLDWTDGGGLLIEPTVDPLVAALSACAHWSEDERLQRGIASRRLVEQRYSAASVMRCWMDLYAALV
jgi:glycosyltransferase involved in cell wall biosynthesis